MSLPEAPSTDEIGSEIADIVREEMHIDAVDPDTVLSDDTCDVLSIAYAIRQRFQLTAIDWKSFVAEVRKATTPKALVKLTKQKLNIA